MNKNLASLTSKELLILNYIIDYIKKNRRSPSFIEIQNEFNYASVNSIQNFIKQLEKKQYIKTFPNQKRQIQVLSGPDAFVKETEKNLSSSPSRIQEINIEAVVAAGVGIEYRVFDEKIFVDKSMLPKGNHLFAVKVQGESMIEDGIFDGDVLILSKEKDFIQGMTAVVSLDGFATVKKLYRKELEKKLELRPANSKFKSIFLDQDKFQIEGRVRALLRKF